MIPEAYINTLLDLMTTTGKSTWCRLSGNSMAPLMCHGDSLLVSRGNRNLRIGDVVIFRSTHGQCAHRIVGVTFENGYRRLLVKGDSRYRFDPPLLPEHVLARVVMVKGAFGTFCMNSAFWRSVNVATAAYSYVQGRRHEGDTPLWRTVDKGFTWCHSLEWLKKLARRDFFRLLGHIKQA